MGHPAHFATRAGLSESESLVVEEPEKRQEEPHFAVYSSTVLAFARKGRIASM